MHEKNHSDIFTDRNLKCNLTIAFVIKYTHTHCPSNPTPENPFHRIKVYEDICVEWSFSQDGSAKHTEWKQCSSIVVWLIKLSLSEKYNMKERACGMAFTLGEKKR